MAANAIRKSNLSQVYTQFTAYMWVYPDDGEHTDNLAEHDVTPDHWGELEFLGGGDTLTVEVEGQVFDDDLCAKSGTCIMLYQPYLEEDVIVEIYKETNDCQEQCTWPE